MKKIASLFFLAFMAYGLQAQTPHGYKYIAEIPAPPGYVRVASVKGSFAEYLRKLPLKSENNTVMLYNGQPKANQNAQFAVVKMDVGTRDLQQCADAIMRLRAEWLYGKKAYNQIHFNFTSGDRANYTDYANGLRASVKGNNVSWQQRADTAYGYRTFRRYMNLVFSYAGTYSMNKELRKVPDAAKIQIGDVFIQTGSPYGHAVLVIDVAEDPNTGARVFMLAQSYMPAQEIHVLVNPLNSKLSPWYTTNFANGLDTPEWQFGTEHLKRW